jgi:Icc-related predicted phosphoesterase
MGSNGKKGLFSRLRATLFGGSAGSVKKPGDTRIFFASDIHGSDACFKMFLRAGDFYDADVLIIGGDVTGKLIIPIVHRKADGRYRTHYKGEDITLSTKGDVDIFMRGLGDDGVYGYVCGEEEYEATAEDQRAKDDLFKSLVEKRMEEWISLADERLKGSPRRVFFNSGNDDLFSIDKIIDQSEVMIRPEGKVVEIDSYLTMISTGFANETPFGCPRDIPEDKLRKKIDAMARQVGDFSRCIFNLHCPPFGTVLDRAPKLDEALRPKLTGFGVEECSAGSIAVREAIQEYQPGLALHGHIHESPGFTRIGKSLCINPGSEYGERVLRGVLIDYSNGALVRHNFTRISAG